MLRSVFMTIVMHFCSGKGSGLGGLTNSQSVSFRQGTNVEFGASAFPPNGPSQRGVSTFFWKLTMFFMLLDYCTIHSCSHKFFNAVL